MWATNLESGPCECWARRLVCTATTDPVIAHNPVFPDTYAQSKTTCALTLAFSASKSMAVAMKVLSTSFRTSYAALRPCRRRHKRSTTAFQHIFHGYKAQKRASHDAAHLCRVPIRLGRQVEAYGGRNVQQPFPSLNGPLRNDAATST